MIHWSRQNFFLYKIKNKNKFLKTYQIYNLLSVFSLSDHNRNNIYYIAFPGRALNRGLVENLTIKVITHAWNKTSKLFKFKKRAPGQLWKRNMFANKLLHSVKFLVWKWTAILNLRLFPQEIIVRKL